MCGIVFAVSKNSVDNFIRLSALQQQHRGPDDSGSAFYDYDGVNVGLAHQRLSILDLSASGRQPMRSLSGNSEIIFNGEIYNYKELIDKYCLGDLRGGSDTEVALELIEKVGIEKASSEFNGMWSLIVLDHVNKKVSISRDRFGKKPLYYLQKEEGVFFASEARSLLNVPGATGAPDLLTATRFLAQSLQNIDERSWFDEVKAFPANSTATISISNPDLGNGAISPLWKPSFLLGGAIEYSFNDAVEYLHWLISDSVKIRLRSDVPVGVALSGGLDSTIISSIVSREASNPSFFSSVHPGAKDDESDEIDQVSRYLGLNVNKVTFGNDDANQLFQKLRVCNSFNDGPAPSFAPLLFAELMKAAQSENVKVLLTGQGADEVFCGYRKYPVLEAKRKAREGEWFSAFNMIFSFLFNGGILSNFNVAEAKRYLGVGNKSILGEAAKKINCHYKLGSIDSLSGRQWDDVTALSVPYLCHYEDRMSMAWSREIRSPFLDYRVVDFGLSLASDMKMNKGWTKYILRESFKAEIPSSIAWKKEKKGFSNPQFDFLAKTLKEKVVEVMSDDSCGIYQYGLVDKKNYLKLFDRYCAGDRRVWFRDVFAPFSLAVWMSDMKSDVLS